MNSIKKILLEYITIFLSIFTIWLILVTYYKLNNIQTDIPLKDILLLYFIVALVYALIVLIIVIIFFDYIFKIKIKNIILYFLVFFITIITTLDIFNISSNFLVLFLIYSLCYLIWIMIFWFVYKKTINLNKHK
jgi:hypothetical protein